MYALSHKMLELTINGQEMDDFYDKTKLFQPQFIFVMIYLHIRRLLFVFLRDFHGNMLYQVGTSKKWDVELSGIDYKR
jgi:hypothetical protein